MTPRHAGAGQAARPLRRLAPRRWSLRTRLLALLLLLLTAVSASIVGISALLLHFYLVHQVDGRLTTVDKRWDKPLPKNGVNATSPDGTSVTPGGAPTSQGTPSSGTTQPDDDPASGQAPNSQGTLTQFVGAPGQTVGTIVALVVNGKIIVSGVLRQVAGQVAAAPLPVTVAGSLGKVPDDDTPRTVNLGSYGEYRVTARKVKGGSVVVFALPLAEVNATVYQLIVIAGCVAGAGVILLGVVGLVTVRRTLRPLRRVASTAARVAELPLDRGEVTLRVRVPTVDTDPRTEVGQVGAALNHMLGHIGAALAARHASETRVRQFVADASHELRTPLAAISGYAQLTRRLGDQVPPDVAYALSRVESESKRMTTLVEDLLLLARLDSGRPLEHGCVDLSRLVVDVASDAHIAAPGHRFNLALPSVPVTVSGDQARLHQVLANLLANARTHTPAGTTVTVALELPVAPTGGELARVRQPNGSGQPLGAGELRLSVIDDGPGIAPDLLPNIFERFARGDSSRSRAAGSTGLGLAIVSAVVEAHGGHIVVASVPGRTAFTVTLPYMPAPLVPALFDEDEDALEFGELDGVQLADDTELPADVAPLQDIPGRAGTPGRWAGTRSADGSAGAEPPAAAWR